MRFGTPTSNLNITTGVSFNSGTEEEFTLAYDSWKKKGSPHILFYRSIYPPESLADVDLKQQEKIQDFFAQFEPGGKHPGLYQKFQTGEEFETCLRRDLDKLLIEYGKKENKPPLPESLQEISPPPFLDTLPPQEQFLGRGKELELILQALSPQDRSWGILIHGIGGMGKTTLAIRAAKICQEKKLFDAYVFVTAKTERLEPEGIVDLTPSKPNLADLLDQIGKILGYPGLSSVDSHEEKGEILLKALQGRKALLIFDNTETLTIEEQTSICEFLSELPEDCKAILTSRRREVDDAATLYLEKMTWEDARELISQEITSHNEEFADLALEGSQQSEELYQKTGGNPLAMLWSLGLIRTLKIPFREAMSILRGSKRNSDLNSFLFQEVYKSLEKEDKKVLFALSLFSGG